MFKQFMVIVFILNIGPAFIANIAAAAEPPLSVDELLRKIGHDNICPLFKDHKISKMQSSTVRQMQQALHNEMNNIEKRTQYINNLQKKYQQSQDVAYRLANQGLTEQLKENKNFLKKQEKIVRNIDKKYRDFFRRHNPDETIYIITSDYPLCRECNLTFNADRKYISIVTSEYKMAFCYQKVEIDDMFNGRDIKAPQVKYIDQTGAMRAVNFQTLFEHYLNDLERIGNNMDINNQHLLHEIGQMNGKKVKYVPQ